jgi:hypothetical protein
MEDTMSKKPLYTGDPNATLTMCPKKLRRHLPHDVQFVSVILPATEEGGKPRVETTPVCRHCKQNPMKT